MEYLKIRFLTLCWWWCYCFLYIQTVSSLQILTSRENNIHSTSTIPFNIYETIWENVQTCRYSSAVVITDSFDINTGDSFGFDFDFFVEKLVSSSTVLNLVTLTHEMNTTMISHEIQKVLPGERYNEKSYTSQPTLYLLITSKPADILKIVDDYVENNLVKRGSVFVHNSKWLVFVKSHLQREAVIEQQRKSLLDNVAVIYHPNDDVKRVRKNCVLDSDPRLLTFIWKENRTRKPQEIEEMADQTPDKKCWVFPNIYSGMNGRRLIVSYFPFEKMFYINNDTKSGIPRYEGFSVYLINIFAEKLNFTYTFTTTVDEEPWTEKEIREAVERGDIDFTGGIWNYRWGDILNITLSMPVFHDSYTGVYRKEEMVINRSQLLVLPFPAEVIALIFGALLFCIVSYTIITILSFQTNINPDKNKNGDLDFLKENLDLDNETKEIMSYYDHHKNAIISSPKMLFKQFFTVILRMFLSLIGQSQLPNPKLMSARMIVFLLSLSTILFYALYTGQITASMIVIPVNRAITNFKDLFATGKYNDCHSLSSKHLFDMLVSLTPSSPGSNVSITTIMKHTCKAEYEGYGSINAFEILKDMKPFTIWLGLRKYISVVVESLNRPDTYVIIPESLFNADQGIMFPYHSEIVKLFNPILLQLKSGKLIQTIENYYSTLRAPAAFAKRRAICAETKIEIGDLSFLGVLITGLTLVSFLILAGEWWAVWRRRYMETRRNKTSTRDEKAIVQEF